MAYQQTSYPSPPGAEVQKPHGPHLGYTHNCVGGEGGFSDEAVVDGPWSETREVRYRYTSLTMLFRMARGERGVTLET